MEIWGNLKLHETIRCKFIIIWLMCYYALGIFEKISHVLHCLLVYHIPYPSFSSNSENPISQNLTPVNSVSSVSSQAWLKPSHRTVYSPLTTNVFFSSMIILLTQNRLGYQRQHGQNLCQVAHGRIQAWRYLNETFTLLFYSPKFLFFIACCQDQGNKSS